MQYKTVCLVLSLNKGEVLMEVKTADVLLVGGGVMSATLGMMLNQLDPSLKIIMVERLDHVAHESTHGWNNAGTGHAGYCELNYTPESNDGTVSINRAQAINASFEVTLQFWSFLVEKNILPDPDKFINSIPHQSLVWGEKDVKFLRERYKLLSAHHLFKDMQYSEDPKVISEWMPLAMSQRDPNEPVAATRVNYGSDVDFGALTRNMIKNLQKSPNFELVLNYNVNRIRQQKSGNWSVNIKERTGKHSAIIGAKFVFLGAGGGALPLLQKSKIPERKGYGGFPVSGQWLVCTKPEVVAQHYSKTYGKAPIGAPPMSVPHLDTRIIDGKPALLFGPFAGFTMKFLKKGSKLDLVNSVRKSNLKPMVSVGSKNIDLTHYLIKESLQSHKERVNALRNFYPEAQEDDWSLAKAGQRVMIIKKDENGKGKLEFGTEMVAAEDGSLAVLLGASPGASTSVQAMIDVIEQCFKERLSDSSWKDKMVQMIPSYGQSLIENEALLSDVKAKNLATLKLS
ncbi:malate dehydrogenase (quinone) [Psychromonas sp. Urea-02u-13]|uniref:malate dehydrogenase (quinone) n=1 Tax=Psychromonas sp. Urea-02u-13 TaxID=2058326 RepID=UPI000C328918|nr:malate dehydrogenase (quinone) [Psychromonas sp. Urea-02u-13]PKG39384.1 malate dehydrogenase (quinone) [Psychromonas sp. Urea-02u-13]